MEKVRDPYFDVVKALAIFMVIFCHVMWIAPVGTFPTWVNNFRVGMNMPIFFILSGYFAWPSIEACDWKKLGKNIRGYFQPALFAGVVFTLVGLAMGLVCPSAKAIAVRLVKSVFVDPWFITTLAECYVLLFLAKWVGRETLVSIAFVLVALLAIACRPSFIPSKIHWGCLVSMMPAYVFGAVGLRKLNGRLWENWKIGLVCFVAFVSFVLLEGDVKSNGMSFYTADSTINAFVTVRGGVCFVLRPIVGIVGSVGVMWVIRMLLDYIPVVGKVATIGTLTLGIYIFHLWPLERLRGIAWIGSGRLSVLITSIAMLAFFSFITLVLMEKTGHFKKWIWGK